MVVPSRRMPLAVVFKCKKGVHGTCYDRDRDERKYTPARFSNFMDSCKQSDLMTPLYAHF